MALTQKELKSKVAKRAEFFESHLRQDVDYENCCQWIRTSLGKKCENVGVVYVWETESIFQHLQPKEYIICKDCIKHFVNGIRKRWRIKGVMKYGT